VRRPTLPHGLRRPRVGRAAAPSRRRALEDVDNAPLAHRALAVENAARFPTARPFAHSLQSPNNSHISHQPQQHTRVRVGVKAPQPGKGSMPPKGGAVAAPAKHRSYHIQSHSGLSATAIKLKPNPQLTRFSKYRYQTSRTLIVTRFSAPFSFADRRSTRSKCGSTREAMK
jgi:hypothetical protein